MTRQVTCPRCGQSSCRLHQNHWYLARDLSISGRAVFLKVNRRQFKCHSCGKPLSETLDFIGNRRKQTDRFAKWIVQQVLHSDVHNVAVQNNLTDEEEESMVQYISKKKLQLDLRKLKRLGIDEIAMRKGLGDYIVVLVDLERKAPIGFTPSRRQEDIKKVLEEWGEAVLNQIVEVSIDLSGNYKGLANKLLPNADVVADRFHVMKIVNQDLNAARNAIRKANEENSNPIERHQVEAALKQSKYALLKPEENLTQKQKDKLEEIREVVPTLAQIHQQKEALRAIFEQAENWGEGALKLLDWLAEAEETFNKSVGTICRWFGEVAGYFENRTKARCC
jgi:transposase